MAKKSYVLFNCVNIFSMNLHHFWCLALDRVILDQYKGDKT